MSAETAFDNALLKEVADGQQAVLEFMKGLNSPAPRTGPSGEATVAGIQRALDQDGAAYVTEDGQVLKFAGGVSKDLKTRVKSFLQDRGRYTPEAEKALASQPSFGEFLRDIAVHGNPYREAPQEARAEAQKRLEKLGVQKMWTDGDGVVHKAALAESSGTTGGYGVPPVMAQQLLTIAIEDAIVPSRATKQPLTSRTLQIPSLDVTTSYGAGQSPFLGGMVFNWTAEAAARTETEPQFRQTTLTAWELSGYTLVSRNFAADQVIGLDGLLTQLFTAGIGWTVDYACFQGNGVGKPLGILNFPAAIAVNRQNSSHFTWVDVCQMFNSFLLQGRANEGSICWVISPGAVGDLLRMNDQSGSQTGTGFGRVLFVPFNEGAKQALPKGASWNAIGTLLGYPVIVSEKLPALGTKGDVILADMSKILFGVRAELQIDVSTHYKFINNQDTYRVLWRGDSQPWLNAAPTLADGSTTRSPFCLLN